MESRDVLSLKNQNKREHSKRSKLVSLIKQNKERKIISGVFYRGVSMNFLINFVFSNITYEKI